MGVVRPASGGPGGFVKLIAVAPANRRRGLGSMLLGSVENALRKRGAESVRVCESAPNYLVPGVDTRYVSAPPFFQRHGYRRFGEACNMTVELAARRFGPRAEEESLTDRGIVFRRARAPDRAGLMRLLERHWPAWADEVDASLRKRPPGLHIAESGGAVILCSLTTIIGYASLYVSANQALNSFGAAMAISEVTCLLAAVISMPAFLLWRARARGK